jgi:hypothetical protein
MDLKKAYEILEIPDNSDIEQVERRYDLLLRRMRKQDLQQTGLEESQDLSQINAAYREIKDAYRLQEIEKYEDEKYAKYKGNAKNVQKMEHFWEYYRFHVFGGILLVILLIMVGQGVIDNRREAALPPPELSIMLFGQFLNVDQKTIEDALLSSFPEWKRVKVVVTPMSLDMSGGYDFALQQKAVVMLATERPSLYIVEKESFQWMMPQGVFLPLEPVLQSTGLQLTAERLVRDPEDASSPIYGVDTSGSTWWKEAGLGNRDSIVTISRNVEDKLSAEYPHALEFLKKLADSLPR